MGPSGVPKSKSQLMIMDEMVGCQICIQITCYHRRDVFHHN
jgi:hypothetical protein